MAEDTVYISDLDPILELAPTDSFVVETLEGTNRILFRDFILGPDNVSFYEEVAANTIAILSLSSDVLTLDEDVTTINSGLTGLSAAYEETIKNGFCNLILTNGTLEIKGKSSNIQSVITTIGSTRLEITTSTPIDFETATINVTLGNSISSNNLTQDFVVFTPIIDGRSPGVFTVGAASVLNHFISLTLPTSVTSEATALSPITSLIQSTIPLAPVVSLTTTTESVLLNPSGNGNVIKTVTANISPATLLTSVIGQTTTTAVVNSVTVVNTPYDFMLSTVNETGATLLNLEFNITFRYV